MSEIRQQFSRSKEDFVLHYKEKYLNNFSPLFCDLPPGWVAIELMTYGNMQNLLSYIQYDEIIMDQFAQSLGVKSFDVLKNWLEGIRQVRNLCAHHSRLFNQNIQAFKDVKKKLSKKINLVKTVGEQGKGQVDQLNRLYTAVVAIHTINSHLGFDNQIGTDIKRLMGKYNVPDSIKRSMGFPADWEKEPFLFGR